MSFIKINRNGREKWEKWEKCSVLYIGVILWIYQPGMSAGAKCGRPGRIPFSSYTPDGQEFSERAIIHYSCDKEDHAILGVSKRECQRDGTWSDEIPVCSELSPIVKTEYLTEDLDRSAGRSNSTCTELPQSCRAMWRGYLSHSTEIAAVRITVNGNYDENIDVEISENNDNAKKCVSKLEISDSTAKSTKTVTFYCPSGTAGDTVYIKCIYQAFSICEVSVLLPPVPQCLAPDIPLHGTGYRKDVNAYSFNCSPGYKLWGPIAVSCQNGAWSHKSPKCDEIYCHAPDKPENGDVKYDSNQRGVVPFNGTAKYSCRKGYHLDGNSTIRCHRWHQWDSAPPKCSPTIPDTATVSSTTILTESRTEINVETCGIFPFKAESQGEWQSVNGSSSLLVLICPKGFHIKGSPAIRQCLSNGSWSYSSAVCEKSFGRPWGNNWTPSLMLIAAVAAGAGTALIILCLSMAFLVIKKRRQTRTNTTVFLLEDTHKNSLEEKNIRQQKYHSATGSYESVIERRSKSASTNSRKPRSALPNLPVDADPVYAQPFEAAAVTEKLSNATGNRKDDLYNTHIYAEPIDSRKSPPITVPLNVLILGAGPAPRIATGRRESVLKTNFENEPPLSPNCAKKCAIYDSSDNSRPESSGNLRSDEKHHRYNEKTQLREALPKNIECLELL